MQSKKKIVSYGDRSRTFLLGLPSPLAIILGEKNSSHVVQLEEPFFDASIALFHASMTITISDGAKTR
jgi:hypothetical protein